jgi:hypothetical protein
MIISRSITLLILFGLGCLWAIGEYRASAGGSTSPDVIVGDIPSIYRWGSSGNETSFSIGTTSCNIGTARMDWIQNSTLHPVISQNMYRVRNGRIEQIGMSWLKHGFSVAAGSLCNTCTDPAWNYLGVGCSDPYGASLNGSQSGLGPRSEVNALTGAFAWPKRNLPQGGTLSGRLRVLTNDLVPTLNPGARYFVESQYVHPQDAAAGNALNNASYREAFVEPEGTTGWDIEVGAPATVRQQPAINAWKVVHPEVQLFPVDIPGDGRVIVGVYTTPKAGGGYHTEFAIENLNSHQSVRSMTVKYGSTAISDPGFRDVDYQFEPYSGTDWSPSIVGKEIQWSTESFAANQNANALRWNSLYSFWCDSQYPPRSLTLGLFRPGTVDEMTVVIDENAGPNASVLGGFVYHAGYLGSGTPPWNGVDTGKSLVQEGSGPTVLGMNNLTNAAAGINGIVLDIQDLPQSSGLDADDFVFQLSPGGAFDSGANPPAEWQAAPAPSSISVTPGEPARVLVEWPSGSIMNSWLRVTVLANEETGLSEPVTYYVGHLLGETTGPTEGFFTVSFADITPIRSEVGQTVDASSVTDVDKNGTVAFADISSMRGNVGAQLTQITVP